MTFQIFPVFYVLTNRKTAECYTDIFEFSNEKFNLEPKEIITDFELGLRKAIKSVWINANLRGCWFHFCSAIRKKAIILGMHSILYSKNANADAVLLKNMLMNIPLLPPESIEEGYTIVKSKILESLFADKFKELLAYFEGYWCEQVFRMHFIKQTD